MQKLILSVLPFVTLAMKQNTEAPSDVPVPVESVDQEQDMFAMDWSDDYYYSDYYIEMHDEW